MINHNVSGKHRKLIRKKLSSATFGIACLSACISCGGVADDGSSKASDDESEVSFGELAAVGNIWQVWGREFDMPDNVVLPAQIRSQGADLFQQPPRIIFRSDSSGYDLNVSSDTKNSISKSEINSVRNLSSASVDLNVNTTLHYDGFLRFDLTLTPRGSVPISEFGIDFHLNESVGEKYSRYIEYDFNTQRANMSDLVTSAGAIGDTPEVFGFNPAVWVGNDYVGLELISETNDNWFLDNPEKAFTLVSEKSSSLLSVRFIELSNAKTFSEPISISFALFVTPSRPAKTENRAVYLGSSETGLELAQEHCSGSAAQFFHWTKLPFAYPGLPVIDLGKSMEDEMAEMVLSSQNKNRLFIPYSSLYILPATAPAVEENKNVWAAAPPRRNKIWSKKLNTLKPILPVTLEADSIKNYLIDQHIELLKNFKTDGIYFDAAAPYENAALKKYGRSLNLNNNPLIYVPMFSHRDFVKQFWEATKSVDRDFLIIHHAPRVPKFATAFIDIVVVGEAINRIFKNPASGRVGIRRKIEDFTQFFNPSYVPDYSALPPTIPIGYKHHDDGVNYMLLPQVLKRNDSFLKKNKNIFKQWSDSAIEFAEKNDLSLWFSRLDMQAVVDSIIEGRLEC